LTWCQLVLLLLSFSFLLLDELSDQLLLIKLVFDLASILHARFLHRKDRLVISVLDEFIFDVFIHHIESIFDIVLGSTWHLLNDF
jgi:hypothetical protein